MRCIRGVEAHEVEHHHLHAEGERDQHLDEQPFLGGGAMSDVHQEAAMPVALLAIAAVGAAGVLAVLPQGAGAAKSWNFSGTTGYDDLGFLSALVTQLTATECADPGRVVITGISDGGDMAAFAACTLPGRFRAVVTVAASFMPRTGCHPIRIVAVHGDADPLDPYRGGPDGRPGYPAIPPATTAITAWADLGGCGSGTTSRVAPDVMTTTYPCGAQLVTVNGGGHTWPGGAPVNPSLGLTTSEYDATATVLGLL